MIKLLPLLLTMAFGACAGLGGSSSAQRAVCTAADDMNTWKTESAVMVSNNPCGKPTLLAAPLSKGHPVTLAKEITGLPSSAPQWYVAADVTGEPDGCFDLEMTGGAPSGPALIAPQDLGNHRVGIPARMTTSELALSMTFAARSSPCVAHVQNVYIGVDKPVGMQMPPMPGQPSAPAGARAP